MSTAWRGAPFAIGSWRSRLYMRPKLSRCHKVFLPFATDAKGQTLYEHVEANPRFVLGDGTEGPA
jgi:hypothetical protein